MSYMNLDNVCIWIGVFILLFILARFIMLRPIEKRYEATLNDLLAKEIARSLYKELHSEFTYKVYHEDDDKRKAILNSCLEEFRKLRKKDV